MLFGFHTRPWHTKTMSDFALSCQQLTHRYPNGHLALDHLNLQIAEGAFFALLGPNGAGKTTLIDLLTGLMASQNGVIHFFGQPINPTTTAKFIGVVPQEINLNAFQTVWQTLCDQAGFYGIPHKSIEKRLLTLLDQLDLLPKKDKTVRALSGGMKRRLMIARALVHEPKFLILDEPTVGVDMIIRQQTWDLLKKLNKSGVTILLTTHYLEEAEALCQEAAFISQGKILKQGTMENLLSMVPSKKLFVRITGQWHENWPEAWTLKEKQGDLYHFDIPTDTDAMQAANLLEADVRQCWEEPANLEDVFRHFYEETA